MRKCTSILALTAAMILTGSAYAGDGCNGCAGSPYEQRSILRRFADRFKSSHEADPSRACVQGKTHLDMGCTNCRAYTVFVFGSCCEFFEHPETFQGPCEKCCNRLRSRWEARTQGPALPYPPHSPGSAGPCGPILKD